MDAERIKIGERSARYFITICFINIFNSAVKTWQQQA